LTFFAPPRRPSPPSWFFFFFFFFQVWADVESKKSSVDTMPLFRSTAKKQAEAMECEWQPPPSKKKASAKAVAVAAGG